MRRLSLGQPSGDKDLNYVYGALRQIEEASFIDDDAGDLSNLRGNITSPYDFSAAGDGITDDTNPVLAAIATGKHVDLRGGTFLVDADVIVLNDFQWMYRGTLTKATAGDFIDMTAQQCALFQVTVDGNSKNGRGIIVGGSIATLGHQVMWRCFVGGCVGYALEFTDPDCGALFIADHCAFARTNSALEAVKLPLDVSGAFTGRFFINTNQGGNAFIDINGGRSTRIIGGGSTKISFSDASCAYTTIEDHRCAFAMTINGTGHSVHGCKIGNTITINGSDNIVENNVHSGNSIVIGSGTQNCVVFANDAVITDNSNPGSNNRIYGHYASPTPVWAQTGGTGPQFNNAVKSARFRQDGLNIRGYIDILMGNTTTFGDGTNPYIFHLPTPYYGKQSPVDRVVGRAWGVISGVYYIGDVLLFGGADADFYVLTPAGALWKTTVPGTWANGDRLNIEFNYDTD